MATSWQPHDAIDGVKLWTRSNSDGLLSVKAQCQVVTRLSAFVTLMNDVAAMRKLIAYSDGVFVLARPSATTTIVKSRFNLPWPARNRDSVTRSVWQQGPGYQLSLTLTDVGAQYPLTPGYLRMQHVQGQWLLTPLGGGLTQIEYQGTASPGGWLPTWLVNRMSVRATATTLNNICQALKNRRYQDSQYSFVKEPPATRTSSERR